MDPTFGLSQGTLFDLQRQAERLIAQYDLDRNLAIDAHESVVSACTAGLQIFGIDQADFRLADKDRDGKLTGKEMVQLFLEECDQNHDGKVGFWEKGGLPGGPSTPFEAGIADMFVAAERLPHGWQCVPQNSVTPPTTSDISVKTDIRIKQR